MSGFSQAQAERLVSASVQQAHLLKLIHSQLEKLLAQALVSAARAQRIEQEQLQKAEEQRVYRALGETPL